MSGHSKWNNIEGRKEKSDAERSKIFTKIGREIMVAVKEGGPNIDSNSKLKMAIAKARQYNMPNDRINGIIKKNSEVDNSNFVEQTYEGYGVGGVAVVVKCFTDNKNRTSSDVKYAFDKLTMFFSTNFSRLKVHISMPILIFLISSSVKSAKYSPPKNLNPLLILNSFTQYIPEVFCVLNGKMISFFCPSVETITSSINSVIMVSPSFSFLIKVTLKLPIKFNFTNICFTLVYLKIFSALIPLK